MIDLLQFGPQCHLVKFYMNVLDYSKRGSNQFFFADIGSDLVNKSSRKIDFLELLK